MRVRQSTLGDADTCLRRMQLNLERPQGLYYGGSVRAVGTGYHAGLEKHYAARLEGSEAAWLEIVGAGIEAFWYEIDRSGANWKWDEEFPDSDSAEAAISGMLEKYFDEEHQWPAEYEVLGVELSFDLPFQDGHSRGGTIDLVLRAPDGGILGVDHKTAGTRGWDQYKHKPRKNNQAPFYVGVLRELFPDAPYYRFVFDIMKRNLKGFERRASDPSPAHIEAVHAKALQVATLYDFMRGQGLDLPANPSSTLCSAKWCDHFATCVHGAPIDY